MNSRQSIVRILSLNITLLTGAAIITGCGESSREPNKPSSDDGLETAPGTQRPDNPGTDNNNDEQTLETTLEGATKYRR